MIVIAPWRARLALFWAGRSERERVLIAVFAALLLATAAVQLLFRPLLAANLSARNDIRALDALNARLRAAGPALGRQAPRRAGAPAEIIGASAAAAGLTVQIAPAGAAQGVTAADVPYDALVRFLGDIEATSGLRVRTLRVERRPVPGLVTATAELAG